MPRSTSKYMFEAKILEGCAKIAEMLLGGHETGCGFTLYIDVNGCVIYFMSNNLEIDHNEAFKSNYGKIFFDPFDAPAYTFIAWNNCTKEMIEKALKVSFEKSDFSHQDKSVLFPTEHGVMF